jgi:hypothetical protein
MNTPPASPRPGPIGCIEERSRGTSSKTFSPCVTKVGNLECYADALKASLEKLCSTDVVFWSNCVKVVKAEDSNKNWSSAYNSIAANRNANVSATVAGNLKQMIINKLKNKIDKDNIKSFLVAVGFEFDITTNAFKIKAPAGMCDNKDVKIFIADVNEFLVKSRQAHGGKKNRQTRRGSRSRSSRNRKQKQSQSRRA